MKMVSFQNKGIIDLSAITTFGVNAKVNDNPFGYFGTGLKYALAVLLRTGHRVTIWRGEDRYEVITKPETIREKDFEIVYLDDQPAGFTLELGKNWDLWQAYRELYCNTMDEAGKVLQGEVLPAKECTTIQVFGDDFYDVHLNKEQIILPESEPDFSIGGCDILDQPSKHLYFKGIRVFDLDKPSRLTYNFRMGVELSEDRQLSNLFTMQSWIRSGILKSSDPELIRTFITADHKTFETSIDMDWNSNDPSDAFYQVVNEVSFSDIYSPTLVNWLSRKKYSSGRPVPKDLNEVQSAQYEKAVLFCAGLGFPVDDYPIYMTADLHAGTLGMAYRSAIFIAERTFNQGTKQVAATMIEEYLHIKMKFRDETYEFQNYLFDLVVTLGERLNGEPL